MTEDLEPFASLAIALAIGLIVGFERGWKERGQPEGSRVAGLRTFGLIGLAGGVFAHLSNVLAPSDGVAILVAGAVLTGAALFVGHWYAMQRDRDVSATGNVAALVTYALGAIAVLGEPEPAAAAAVVMALLLGLKPRLHAIIAGLDERELMAALRLLLISVVALPLLPDRGFGPYGALNPYELWWFVVLIAGLSFAGYVAVKAFGAGRGLLLTGLAGGLVSSTVVAITFARLAHEKREMLDAGGRRLILAGILVGSTVMPLRLLVLIAIVSAPLGAQLAPPLLVLGVTGFAIAWYLARHADRIEGPALAVENPVDVLAALRFAALLALIMLTVPALREWLGAAGLYLLALVSGVVDVDAISLSTARLAGNGVTTGFAASVVLTAVAANTVAKAGWILLIAGRHLALGYSLASLAMLAAAAAMLLIESGGALAALPGAG